MNLFLTLSALWRPCLIVILLVTPACMRRSPQPLPKTPASLIDQDHLASLLIPLDEEISTGITTPQETSSPTPPPAEEIDQDTTGFREQESLTQSLDFKVENKTGKELYLCCFSYVRKNYFGHWRWDKSALYQSTPGSITTIDIDYIPDEQDRKNVFGYLALFETEEEAREATMELMDDNNLLDLDILENLHGKQVTLTIEKYGFKGKFYDFDFEKKNDSDKKIMGEFDFPVENLTGKTIHVVGFIYQKKAKGSWFGAVDEKDDMSTWRFDKTPIITLQANELGIIDVDTLDQARDRDYIRGYLAIFDESERELAEQSTYELLESWRKINLGRLQNIMGKKVVLGIEQYGIDEDFIDFVIKEPRRAIMKQAIQ